MLLIRSHAYRYVYKNTRAYTRGKLSDTGKGCCKLVTTKRGGKCNVVMIADRYE